MRVRLPRDRLRNVHERDVASCDYHEFVDPRHHRDVQRDEFIVGERKSASPPGVEEYVLGRSHRLEYDPPCSYPLHSLLHGKNRLLQDPCEEADRYFAVIVRYHALELD